MYKKSSKLLCFILGTIGTTLLASACAGSSADHDSVGGAASKAQGSGGSDGTAKEERMRKLEVLVNTLHRDSFSKFKREQSNKEIQGILLASKNVDQQTIAQTANALSVYYSTLPVTTTIQVPLQAGSTVFVSFDCVPIDKQPAVTSSSGSAIFEQPPTDPDTESGTANKPIMPTAPVGASSAPSSDPKVFVADAADAACPAGTVPLRRRSLAEAVLEPGITGFSLKQEQAAAAVGAPPAGAVIDRNAMRIALGLSTIVIPESTYKHRYAHAYQAISNMGVSSRLNVWKPEVNNADMSLSQVWVTAGSPNDNSLQTVEAGWQVYNMWQTDEPALFVFQTSDNYGATGCYVTRCQTYSPARPEQFRITSNKIVIGKPVTPQSSIGGAQAVVQIKWIRNVTTGSWWLRVDDEWVGYYPSTVFTGGGMAGNASFIDFGGETTGISATSQMGSGHYAQEGKGYAGFQDEIRYLNTAGSYVDASLTKDEPDIPCYTLVLNGNQAPEAVPGTFFYFGGPGTHHFSMPPPSQEGCVPPP